MARHDREESLEEQLAWLDAIKEQEEEAPALAVKATAVDDTVVSPYPKDPWSLVPTEPDTTSSPLFRAAVDSAHPDTDPPAEDADAAEWMEASDTVSSFTVPAPASGKQDNDGFLAPLKPLPRQEPVDAGDYGLADFTEPHIRTPFAAPAQEPSRGLFEQPQRPAEAEPFTPPAPASAPAPASDESSDLEPLKPSSSDTERFTFGSTEFGGTDSDRFSFGSGGTRSTSGGKDFSSTSGDFSTGTTTGTAGTAEADRSPSGTTGSGTSGSSSSDDGDRFSSGAAEADRFPAADTEHDRDRTIFEPFESFETTMTSVTKESPKQATERFEPASDRFEPASDRFEPVSAPVPPSGPEPEPESFRAPESFGVDRPEPAVSPERPFTSGAFGAESTSSSFGTERSSSPPPPAPSGSSGSSGSSGFAAFSGPTAFAPGRDASPATERETVAPQERVERAERESPFAPGREAAEPVREPYQARRRQTAPAPAFGAPARHQPPGTAPRQSADSLDPESLLRGRRNAPAGGWRKLVYKASAGLIKPGESPEVRRRRELVGRARTPVATGHHRVAVLSLKGGVGKTTTTVGLGATLAQVRGDRVIAVDANPDRGTLSDKVELETSATVRDLLNERQQIKRYVDIRAFTSQAPSRLEILASDRDPSVSEAFSAADYQSVSQVLENFYSICITDCGTGLLHSAMSGVLGLADQLVLVSSPSVDGARAASATLDWLEAHHYEELVRSATVVLCSVRPRSKSTVDLDRLEAHFAARCRAVIRVPYDPHLEEGAEIDLERLQPGTRESYLRLAASVGDGFAGPQP
ncbi:MinD/ParA family protein [Streptosporangium sp. NBC_01495]|uniref:MinD/ParA family ATP-binding protein n=1 Tax=Streptosporangium sp. NBC_01495 TaxID=2903899 RepID=UPI002E357750|nr:MinD/ParA family protein [Streptosporangium sp. NBC_01495]